MNSQFGTSLAIKGSMVTIANPSAIWKIWEGETKDWKGVPKNKNLYQRYRVNNVWKEVPLDSIQCLNFSKICFNSISDSIMADQNSIQIIIHFKNIGGDSFQLIIQSRCQGIINTGRIRKVPGKCPKCVQNRQK